MSGHLFDNMKCRSIDNGWNEPFRAESEQIRKNKNEFINDLKRIMAL